VHCEEPEGLPECPQYWADKNCELMMEMIRNNFFIPIICNRMYEQNGMDLVYFKR
jgi:hypothetical protein